MKLALFAMAALRTTFPALEFGSAAQFRADVTGVGYGAWGIRFDDDGDILQYASSGSVQNAGNPATFLNPTSPFIAHFCEVRLVVSLLTREIPAQVNFVFGGAAITATGATAWRQVPRGGLQFLIEANGNAGLLTEFEVQIRNRFTLQTITRAARYAVSAFPP